MKLLFDSNLSTKLRDRLSDLFPGSIHFFDLSIPNDDYGIFRYARENGYDVITTDDDFIKLLKRLGPPPKIIHLKQWRYKTPVAEGLIRYQYGTIQVFGESEEGLLIISVEK